MISRRITLTVRGGGGATDSSIGMVVQEGCSSFDEFKKQIKSRVGKDISQVSCSCFHKFLFDIKFQSFDF
jgi:hypothetical protein